MSKVQLNANLTMAAVVPKNTTAILKQLRALMQNIELTCEPLAAYIVPSVDAHNSEYPPANAKRREFISGFDGSVGTAIITQKEALMWTDSRYHLQATQEMDENWTLMKEGLPSVPTQGKRKHWIMTYTFTQIYNFFYVLTSEKKMFTF